MLTDELNHGFNCDWIVLFPSLFFFTRLTKCPTSYLNVLISLPYFDRCYIQQSYGYGPIYTLFIFLVSWPPEPSFQ